MGGIAGIVTRNPQRLDSAVAAMLRSLVHRGPDDEGYERLPMGPGDDPLGPTLGLGYRRFATIDATPTGRQPIRHPGTGDVLAFDGFISGHQALRYRLESLGCVFRGTGDAEVLLHALTLLGEAVLDEIDGMFSLAFYHAATRRLLLARDPLGTKPLYVASTNDAVVFASEVRAVLASGMIDDALDPAGIATFLAYGAPQDPLTVHREVRSFPAGCSQWITSDPGRRPADRPRRYWSFPVAECSPDAASLADEVEFELSRAIRDHGVTDRPSCVFFSGGIDSAAVAAFAHSLTGPVQTFLVGYEGRLARDGAAERAAAIAHAIGARHHQTMLDDEWALLQFTQWLRVGDRPSIGGFNTYVISGAAGDAGIAVALSGLGGDELFGGYACFHSIPQALRAALRVENLPAWARGPAGMLARPLLARLATPASGQLLAERPTPFELVAMSQRVVDNPLLQRLGLEHGALGLSHHYLPPADAEPPSAPAGDVFHQISTALCRILLGNSLLRDTDCYGMANCVEIRTPLLARKIVDLVAPLPEHFKSPLGSPPKHLLRLATADRIPPAVFKRRIPPASLPFLDWMYGPLRDVCEAAVAEAAASGLLSKRGVEEAWRDSSPDVGRHAQEVPLALVALGSYLRCRRTAAPASPAT